MNKGRERKKLCIKFKQEYRKVTEWKNKLKKNEQQKTRLIFNNFKKFNNECTMAHWYFPPLFNCFYFFILYLFIAVIKVWRDLFMEWVFWLPFQSVRHFKKVFNRGQVEREENLQACIKKNLYYLNFCFNLIEKFFPTAFCKK